jgi:hypothetical protein
MVASSELKRSSFVINEAAIRRRFETLGRYLDERQRRVFTTSEAFAAGWGDRRGSRITNRPGPAIWAIASADKHNGAWVR